MITIVLRVLLQNDRGVMLWKAPTGVVVAAPNRPTPAEELVREGEVQPMSTRTLPVTPDSTASCAAATAMSSAGLPETAERISRKPVIQD